MLGRFAEGTLGDGGGGRYGKLDRVLEYLYGREYVRRGVRSDPGSRGADLSPSVLAIPDWLREVSTAMPSPPWPTRGSSAARATTSRPIHPS